MKKKQWYVFTVLFFLVFLALEYASGRPEIYAVDIHSLSDFAWWIDNEIEEIMGFICIAMSAGCMTCAHWAED